MAVRGTWKVCSTPGSPRLPRSRRNAGMLGRSPAEVRLEEVVRQTGRVIGIGILAAGWASPGLHAQAHPGAPHAAPAPHYSAPPPRLPSSGSRPGFQPRSPGQEHLGEWLQKNNGLSAQEQIRKLRQEKGFNRLSPQQQQKVTNRLQQLNQMPPDQRQRVLERVENMERLSPQNQGPGRGSARQLGQMAPERQQAVKDAIRNLRNVPPGLRQQELNSSKYAGLTREERGIAGNLLSVESYHPQPPPQ